MRRKIYTANEEMTGAIGLILFTLVWYISLLKGMLESGFQKSLIIFLVAGIMPAYQAVRIFQKAIYFRNFHKQCMGNSFPQKGRITNISREYFDEYTSNNRRKRTTYYFLMVEVENCETGIPHIIKSDAYRIPIYKYLASPYVQVYTDKTGWKHVIDGFQLKQNRNEPDIPLENSNVYLKDFSQPPALFRLIYIVILVMMLLQILGIL